VIDALFALDVESLLCGNKFLVDWGISMVELCSFDE
jgi:hypothetical protein